MTSNKNKLVISFIALFLFSFVGSSLYAQNNQISVIISSQSTHSISEDQIKQIYSGNISTWSNGDKIIIADQGDTEVGSKFYNNFVEAQFGRVKVEWTKKVLSGQMGAPKKCKNDNEVKSAVSKSSSAIGYILSSNLDSSVKEIFKFSE